MKSADPRAATARALTAIVVLPLAGAFAATSSSAAALPDWSGLWHAKGSVALISSPVGRMFVQGTADDAPLKPQYATQYHADLRRALEQGDPNAQDVLTDTNTLYCFAGFPRILAAPFNYIFINTPHETFIIVDKEVRQVFTDGRPWPPPDARWPLMLGRSNGHWEGDTLVIYTINMRSDMWLDTTPLMLSSDATVQERLHQIDAGTIEDQITIHDPVRFTHDWHFVRDYVRRDSHEWPDDPEICGGPEDRNPIVNGRVTTEVPAQPPATPQN